MSRDQATAAGRGKTLGELTADELVLVAGAAPKNTLTGEGLKDQAANETLYPIDYKGIDRPKRQKP